MKVGDIIIIRPNPKQYKRGEPWLGKVKQIMKRKINFKFLWGEYNMVWQVGIFREDVVYRSQVEGIINWNEAEPMPTGLVHALKKMLD